MPNHIETKKMPAKNLMPKFRYRRTSAPAPPKKVGFFRRIFQFVFHPVTVSTVILLLTGVGLVLAYFWVEYSDKVDLLLRGEVFTKTAGIYSAPKTLRDGENIAPEDLIKYLKSAGYVEKVSQADDTRGRFRVAENTIEIEPGASAAIDDLRFFKPLQVKFDKDRKKIESITDLSTKQAVKRMPLEPKILSSIAAEGDGRRKAVTFQDLPPHLIKAVTVTEDRAFFEHYGVNFRGIARALWRRYEGEEDSPLARQGGSSITQQLVKNLLLSSDQTLERKLKEAYMSVILETRLTKEEIFTLYANQIYLGQQAGVSIYGVGEAANAYFGKDVSALSISEAAFLAGIIRSPNRYNPYKNQEKVTERRNQVLESMRDAGEITAQQFDQTKAEQLRLVAIKGREELTDMPYFTQYVEERLPEIINDPEALQHLRVYTTIDPDLQRAAYEAVTKRLEKLEKAFPKKEKGSLQAALVALNPKTGEIVAMIGGRNFLENQFNRATDAMRQPGSVFKPFVYAAALNTAYDPGARVLTPATVFKDEKKTFNFGTDSYSPNNYGDVFSNKEITLRDALVKSKNTITVDIGMELNVGKVMNLAAKAGLARVEKAYPSMSLGTAEATPLQVATAYTVFANMGDKVSPMAINRITTGEGRTVVAPVAERQNVLRPDVAYIMNDIMKDVINRGTATDAQAWGLKNAAGKFGFAGKTGTSRDGWFAGFTPDLVCVVYVGFDDNDDLDMKGSDSALPIWADFMREALNQHPEWNGDWEMPDSVIKAEIDTRDGRILRELDGKQAEMLAAQQKAAKGNSKTNNPAVEISTAGQNYSASAVPPEFRRVEFFISGTIPREAPPVEDFNAAAEPLQDANPQQTVTPFMTWEEAQAEKDEDQKQAGEDEPENYVPPAPPAERTITVMICPLSGARATLNCPTKQSESFKLGEEPRAFCTFHSKSRSEKSTPHERQ